MAAFTPWNTLFKRLTRRTISQVLLITTCNNKYKVILFSSRILITYRFHSRCRWRKDKHWWATESTIPKSNRYKCKSSNRRCSGATLRWQVLLIRQSRLVLQESERTELHPSQELNNNHRLNKLILIRMLVLTCSSRVLRCPGTDLSIKESWTKWINSNFKI